MPKKQYEKPEFEVTILATGDILTGSENDDENQGEWDPLAPKKNF